MTTCREILSKIVVDYGVKDCKVVIDTPCFRFMRYLLKRKKLNLKRIKFV